MSLENELRDLARLEGAEFFGVADLSVAHAAIVEQGGPEIGQYPRAISIGIGLLHSIVDQLSAQADARTADLYRYYCYDLVNDRLDKAASRLSGMLQGKGWRALPVPAAPYARDNERLCGIFSNKMAAHLAGLGWIGKSCLLVTPEAGPRARWATVLTDAPLNATGGAMAPRCGDCRACVAACPAKAFTGRPFRQEEPREARFRARDCSDHLRKLNELNGRPVCGLCVKVCPHGIKASRKGQTSADLAPPAGQSPSEPKG